MSERIHNVNARGDAVVWSKLDLGNEWSQKNYLKSSEFCSLLEISKAYKYTW
ncbi:5536_t:CDS:2 [Entrophospora sp. SA101]|nr:5536_t:CDS:2 [Entrophospora sp. SA101]